ncbi:putative acetyl-CoA carboxylase [Lupinus albus]|uniref:Putative acetyl-CoA carboxylase n=1 Tax=Lupinus albus TaxID=3870 RepID=A0A6A4PS26_LUPAL|nr:putative acetyl-CoA carboxylase [Lupinus albus]
MYTFTLWLNLCSTLWLNVCSTLWLKLCSTLWLKLCSTLWLKLCSTLWFKLYSTLWLKLCRDRIDSYQRKIGLTEAVQTGTGQLNGIPLAIGIMDFQFMGGSMGSVVGEKITRLVEYATNQLLPLILVCASGGARMQEGSLSLMQMAKISSALYNYQTSIKLFYVSILTSPTTGGVTASFGMLGDIIIAEPNAYIAFAGKRVIEQTLNKTIPLWLKLSSND